MKSDTVRHRLRIDRLDVDLRGIDPAMAQASVRLLGPALVKALGGYHGQITPAEHIDAGHLTTQPSARPADVASQLAQHIAAAARGTKP